MNRLALRGFIAICLAFTVSGVVRAAAPTPAPPPTAAPAESSTEQTFVSTVTSDLQSRFATTAQATAAGYFRYTDEDQTGAISWVNIKSWQSDEQHPSQLWYDVSGRLIGADFSVLQSNSKARPEIWGVSPSRWLDFYPVTSTSASRRPRALPTAAQEQRRWRKSEARLTTRPRPTS